MSQISLLEKKYTICPGGVDHYNLGIVDENLNTTYLKDFNWNKTKKVVKFFGRFYNPFGVEKENIIQFILDPCYFEINEPHSQNVHIQPKYIRSAVESESSLGLERWQTPSVFIIGLLKQFQTWQPFVVEPLCIYTSDEEKEKFHAKLIDKSLKPLRDTNEFGFEDLSDKYGLKKAEEFEETIEREIKKTLSENCWGKASEVSELINLFSVIIDLLREKDESDAVRKILGYSYMSSSELAHQMFDKEKSFLMEISPKYHSLLLKILSDLDPQLDMKELISKGIAFYELALNILEKGRLKILRRIADYPFYNVRLSLILNGNEKRFTLKNIDDDWIKILKELCNK